MIKAFRRFIHDQAAAAAAAGQQINRHGITDEFFNGIAHRTRAQFRMESRAAPRMGELTWSGVRFVAFGFQERQFLVQQQVGDF